MRFDILTLYFHSKLHRKTSLAGLQQLPDDAIELTQGMKPSAESPFFQMLVWEFTARDAGTTNHCERRTFFNIWTVLASKMCISDPINKEGCPSEGLLSREPDLPYP
jgi:hypothetical protein